MKKTDVIAAGYCRGSTPMQVDGLSLDVQQEQVENYIRSYGWKQYRIFVEPGFSAKDSDRPNFQEMLRHLRAGKFDVLVVPKTDRFFRNVRLLLEFVENELKPNDVQLVSVAESIDTTTAAGNTLFQIIGIFAAMERERMAERTRDSMRKKALKGPAGGHRYGYKYDVDGNCRIDPDEAEVVKTFFRLFVNEDMSTTQIADLKREMLETEAPTFYEKLFELLAGNFEKAFASFSIETKRSVTKAIVKNVAITDGVVTKLEFHPPFDVTEADI